MASGFEHSGTDLDSLLAAWHSGWPQAGVTEFEIGGSDIRTRYATLATGSAAAATGFRTSTSADLNTIFAGYGTTGVTVGTQPSAISGSAAAGTPSGTVTSNTTTCAAGPQGGPTKTYTWHIANGSGFSLTAPNSATTGVTGVIPAGQTVTGGIYCTISDGVTSTNTVTISISLTNTSPVFSGAQHTYGSGSGTETVPAGATQVIIEVWGPGGTGAFGTGSIAQHDAQYGAGGAAGGYSRSNYSCSGGNTLNYSVGTTFGATSTVSSGSLVVTTMTAYGGNQGSLGGNTASGGNAANVVGANGGPGGPTSADGAGASGTGGLKAGPAGAGGHGGFQQGNAGAPGGGGLISFYYPS